MSTPDPLNIAGIIIAVVAALGAWLSHRSSSKATVTNAKAAAEVEAYNRARSMDLETIRRQDEEYSELLQKHNQMKKRVADLEAEVEVLQTENAKHRRRIAALEARAERDQDHG